jgi:hypothetical protein
MNELVYFKNFKFLIIYSYMKLYITISDSKIIGKSHHFHNNYIVFIHLNTLQINYFMEQQQHISRFYILVL